MSEFGFQNLGAGMLGLVFTLAAAALLLRAEKRRISLGRLLGLAGAFERRRALLPAAICLLLSLSLSRPYTGYEDTTIPGIGRDILLVIDVSRSMLAADASPSRLAAAKRKAADVIDRIEQTSPGDRIGIVLFAGESYLFCPLTSDYAVVRVFASAISPELITSGGSALGKALELVAQSVDAAGSVAPLVIVLSDGEDNTLETEAIGAKLHRRGIKVNVVALGTPEGRPIALPGGAFVKDDAGNIVVSKLNESALLSLARSTEGRYFRAAVADDDIRQILDGGAAKGRRTTGETVRTFHDIGPLLALAALVGILIPFAWGGRSRGGAFVLLLAATSWPLCASADSGVVGAARYHAGAAEAFRSKAYGPQADWRDFQALGSAEYKQRRFKEAQEALDGALSRARTAREKYQSFFNRGNAKVMSGDFKGAIADYDAALALKPGDSAAETNRRVAEKLLEQTPPPPKEAAKQPQGPTDNKDMSSPESGESGSESEAPQEAADPRPSASPDEGSQGRDGSANDSPPKEGASEDSASSKERSSADEAEGETAGEPTGSPTPASSSAGAATKPPPAPSLAPGAAETSGNEQPGDTAQGLRAEEAKSWLQALDEAPVLLEPRGQRRRVRGSQSW